MFNLRKSDLLFVCLLIIGTMIHCFTLSYSPVPWGDESDIDDIARGGIVNKTMGQLNWLGFPGSETRSWALYWLGGFIHHAAYLTMGHLGPRIIMLALFCALAIMVRRYLLIKTDDKLIANIAGTKNDTIHSMKELDRAGSCFLRAILRRMKELGLNQSALAKCMNASRPYVAKVLHGEVSVTLRSAARFAHALQMDFLPVLTPKDQGARIDESYATKCRIVTKC